MPSARMESPEYLETGNRVNAQGMFIVAGGETNSQTLSDPGSTDWVFAYGNVIFVISGGDTFTGYVEVALEEDGSDAVSAGELNDTDRAGEFSFIGGAYWRYVAETHTGSDLAVKLQHNPAVAV